MVMVMAMADKEIVMQELSRTVTRLKNRGLDTERVFFGHRAEKEELDPSKVLWQPEKPFVKVFPDEIAQVLKETASQLSGTDTAIMLMLMSYISYESGMLTKGGGYPLMHQDIQRITGFNKKTIIYSMEKLVKRKVFSRNRVGKVYQYFANPYIFFRGKYINATLVDMFKSYREPLDTIEGSIGKKQGFRH